MYNLMSFLPGIIWGCWLLVLSGFAGVFPKTSIENGVQIIVLTSFGGGLFLFLYCLARKEMRRLNKRVIKNYGIIGVIEFIQGGLFISGAYLLIDSAGLLVPFIRIHTTYLVLIVGFILSKLKLAQNEPITRRKIICGMATGIGLSLLILEKNGTVSGIHLGGLTLLILSVFASAFQHFFQPRLSEIAGKKTEMIGTLVQVVVTALLGTLYLLLTDKAVIPDGYSFIYFAMAGVFMTGIAFMIRFISYARAHLTSFEMALRQETEQIVQVLTAVLFLGSALTSYTVLAGVLVFGAGYFVAEVVRVPSKDRR